MPMQVDTTKKPPRKLIEAGLQTFTALAVLSQAADDHEQAAIFCGLAMLHSAILNGVEDGKETKTPGVDLTPSDN